MIDMLLNVTLGTVNTLPIDKDLDYVSSACLALRACRRNLGYTQEEVAEALGLTSLAYHKVENGVTKLTLAYIVSLSSLFETTPLELIKMTQVLYEYSNNPSNYR